MPNRRRLASAGALSAAAVAVTLLVAVRDADAQAALRRVDGGAVATSVVTRCAAPLASDAAATADSLGEGDDSLPAEAVPPESGMVFVDRNGHEVHAPRHEVAVAVRPSCQPSIGSAMRPRSADAMMPPPSTMSSSP